jgi:hypothetical protein
MHVNEGRKEPEIRNWTLGSHYMGKSDLSKSSVSLGEEKPVHQRCAV